ncbi:hypothetical protein EA462_05610 [Natrarchaeobius halalkaliphilus]|uniref:Gins51 C-terminal domain-containing protein n=1 Tax=Natrarchaeobius halalkaliphilus TaxID=1679091 RepID=A0A3N6LUZ6_9EURY|nr:hypothetical protein [Natrarchaeobius halalkaliphilus]RQG91444.1 hypothetical protein EA462_05610 [Natrarchaeobius halalkaliphilus]
MNLDELRSVQSKERKKDSLQHLRPSFYQEVGEYIADLEAERDRVAETADDPFSSPEVGRLTDEIETAKDVVEAVYERRMGKLVKQASLSAAGMQADDEGLTAEESDLFDDLVTDIESNKSRVLDVLEGRESDASTGSEGHELDAGTRDGDPPEETPSEPPQPPEPETEPGVDPPLSEGDHQSDTSGVTAADVMDGETDSHTEPDPAVPPRESGESSSNPDRDADETEPDDIVAPDEPDSASGGADPAVDGADHNEITDEPSVERVTVKITRDVGSILGVDDREYRLSADDVVTLPEQNATPLVDREAAEPLE